ncbi:MAG: CZB domain-containing protein [Burkholderiales bacterium]|nr:CZB domain-containing protein [Burkholderiales bacterium]
MDIESAIGKHAEWKVKFRAAIAKKSRMDVELIGNTHCCEIGNWIDGEGKKDNAHLPEFAQLVKTHEQFHREAVKLAGLINAGRYSDAEHALNTSAYADVSRQMTGGIMKLKKVINRVAP